jgi:hypothetical protein
MASPTTTVVHADVGLAFNTIEGTTTTIVKRLITRGQNIIRNVTGTTTGANHDEAIRALVDHLVVKNALATLDPNKDNIEGYIRLEENFKEQANNALRLLGKSLDGVKIQFVEVNP